MGKQASFQSGLISSKGLKILGIWRVLAGTQGQWPVFLDGYLGLRVQTV